MYRKRIEERLEEFKSSEQGLTQSEAEERIQEYGRNELQEEQGDSIIGIFFKNFKDVMIIILLIAAGLSAFLGEYVDAIIILAIVIVNAIISTVQSVKAQKSLDALKQMSTPESVVLRNGKKVTIPSTELVPGDVVFIEAGNVIPADGRLLESVSLKVEESALTGESEPVEKDKDFYSDENLPIGDRKNMVFGSTTAVYGRGKFLVTNTGMSSEIGKIAFMLLSHEDDQTPLQRQLGRIGNFLAAVVVIVALGVFALGWYQGRDLLEMFMTSISLAVAAIPEGLPAIVTIVLALGVVRLSKKNAIIKNLPSVETLGSASVICSDKTGTLTQNKMEVTKAFLMGDDSTCLVEGMALCNDANYDANENAFIGDPTETALLEFAVNMDKNIKNLEGEHPRVYEIPFDSNRKRMTTVHKQGEGFVQYTKGGLDEVLSICNRISVDGEVRPITKEDKYLIHEKHDEYAKEALRILALAYNESSNKEELVEEENMIFMGLVGMIDPPRETTKDSIKKAKLAGITPVMITGDHLQTAVAIAKETEILDENTRAISGNELEKMTDEALEEQIADIRVFARVSPEHKVRIVKAWQKRGQTVAMTGDGVNDAPALKTSDIGVAMGVVGTDVSRQAADMVLADDNFSTIVTAVEEGRTIFDNIRRTVRFLLSCNFGEIVLIVAAIALGMDIPLIPIHILWVNLVSDSFPALALGIESREKDVMARRPRPQSEGILTPKSYFLLAIEGLLIGGLSFVAFRLGMQTNLDTARTMAFATIAFTQLVHSFNLRSNMTLFSKGLFSNKYFIPAVLVSLILMLVTLLVPPVQEIFKTVNLSTENWLYVAGLSIIPLIFTELRKIFIKG